jgi:hypothetical protein
MPGIYVMAVLTIGVTALLCIATLNRLTAYNRRYCWLLLAGLPISPIVNRLIKIPVITSLAAWTGLPLKLGPAVPVWFLAAIWLNAPIFEEAIKALPMILPGSRTFLRDDSPFLWAGLALGMGFGLGEAAYLAYGVAQSPAYNGLPWYMFSGFAFERSIVTFAHGFMTGVAVSGLQNGRGKALSGYLTAVGLHALINLGPILLAARLVPATISSMGTIAAILGAFLVFQKQARMARKSSRVAPQEILYFERS